MEYKYVIIIPAKNEDKSIHQTLDSIVQQSFLPEVCLVVDDNSDDDTPAIVKDYETNYPFIKYFKNNQPKQTYSLGGHVVEVFTIGLNYLKDSGYKIDYAIKLDADLTFDSDCIKLLFEKVKDHNPGIFSGTPYYMHNGIKINDFSPEWHAHGQFKIYNTKCLDDIGGIPLSLGWDTADNIKAMSKGWNTVAFRDVFYKMHRKVGGKSSLKKGRINHGIGSYVLRYNFGYFIVKVLHDLFRPPYFLGAGYMFYGYWKAFFSRREIILDKKERRVLRKLLWESFFVRFKDRDFVIFQLFSSKK